MLHWQSVTEKTFNYCTEHQLFHKGASFIVGISGGPDSVFLSHFLAEHAAAEKFTCHLAHVNYGLRGEASDADEVFCEKLAKRFGWPISVLRLNREDHDSAEESNFQAWARKKRYDYFYELGMKTPRAEILVGHHLSDQVETFFLRVLRGSGPSGLTGMKARSLYRGVPLIRPLLCLTRSEILEALLEAGIEYRKDASNESHQYRRNRLRQGILPQLKAIEPKFEQLTGEALQLWQGEDALLQDIAREHLKKLSLNPNGDSDGILRVSRKGMQELPRSLRLRVLREMIGELTGGPQSITFHHIRKMDDLVCHGSEKARYDLPEAVHFELGPLVVTLTVRKN